MDALYKELLDVYKNQSTDAYAKEAAKVSRKLKANVHAQSPTHIPYPSIYDPNFHATLYAKKEFHRNQTTLDIPHGASYEEIAQSKCSMEEFKLTPSQKFLKNFFSPMTPYKGLLLFHSVGVGKTCPAISIAEQYLSTFSSNKRVLVVLSSNIKDNFKKQIFDMTRYDPITGASALCTGTRYPDMILDKDVISKELLEKRINRLIKERYQFVGYKELAVLSDKVMAYVKKHEKNPEKHKQRYEEKIRDMFSGRLIIVDEAHNLRMQSDKGRKLISQTFVNLLKLAQNTRLVLMTATPMFNNVREIVWLMNLLLLNEKRPTLRQADVFAQDGTLKKEGKDTLSALFAQYVSYMRGENPFSFPFRLFPGVYGDPKLITPAQFPSRDMRRQPIPAGEKIRHLEIIGSAMSKLQKRMYEVLKGDIDVDELSGMTTDSSNSNSSNSSNSESSASNSNSSNSNASNSNSEDGDEADDAETLPGELQNALQLSNIVYPTLGEEDDAKRSFGSAGFNEVFLRKKKSFQYKPKIEDKYGQILSYPLLQEYSPKIKAIIDYILNSKGIVFVYSQYYYSGVFPLAIALEHVGFAKYNAENMAEGIDVEARAGGKKPLTYVLLSRDKDFSTANDAEIAVARSPQNAHGELIKVILVTKVATEGIDFKNIREVHLLEPWFNLNRAEQIIGRAVRRCSHMQLPVAERNVLIYFHASRYTKTEESVDEAIYRMAENKQRQITAVQKLMKQNALDCFLNRQGLIYDPKKLKMTVDIQTSQGHALSHEVGDKDGSYLCDYGKCEAKCAQGTPPVIAPEDVNASTFDPAFITDDIDLYKRHIMGLYARSRVEAFTFQDIVDKLPEADQDVLAYALQELLDQRTKIVGSSGREGYLIYKGNTYIFQPYSVTDTRLTIEEREDFYTKKHRLPWDKLSVAPAVPAPAPGPAGPGSATKPSAASVAATMVQAVADKKAALENLMKPAGAKRIKDAAYYDAMLDRLREEDFKALVAEVATGDGVDPEVTDALMRTGLCVANKSGRPAFFYSHFDSQIYAVRANGTVELAGALDYNRDAKLSGQLKAIQEFVAKSPAAKGLIQYKEGEAKFKVLDNPAGAGYVCAQTSSLKVDDLKQRIDELMPNLLKDTKFVKKSMCDVYEIVLRAKGAGHFRRPFFVTQKKKGKN